MYFESFDRFAWILKSQSMGPILSQEALSILPSPVSLTSVLTLLSYSGFPLGFQTQIWYAFLALPMCTKCLVHFLFNLLNLFRHIFRRVRAGILQYPSSIASRPALWPTQPPIQSVPEALSPGVERQGRKADHSPPPNAGVNHECSHTSVPHKPSLPTYRLDLYL